MSSIGKTARRAAAVSLLAATAALTLGVGAAAASTDKPPYDPKSITQPIPPVADIFPGTIPAVVNADPGPVAAIVARGPGPLPAIVATEPGPVVPIVAAEPPYPPFTGTDKPPYDPKS